VTEPTAKVLETLDNLVGPVRRLQRSLGNAAGTFPIHATDDTDEVVDEVDQFLQRFLQVTDITLRGLFPRVATAFFAAPSPQYFRDLLDKLERAEIIDDAAWWVELNNLRNRLVHEYAMEPVVRQRELNAAWTAASTVVQQIERVRVLAEKLW
jgi:hypothetical protein